MRITVINLLISTFFYTSLCARTIEIDPKELLDKINEERKEFAIEQSIANMNKLEWDEELAAHAARACDKSEEPIPGRLVAYESDDPEYRKAFWKWVVSKVENEIRFKDMGLLEMMNPLQQKVGCSRVTCKWVFEDSSREFRVKTSCVLMPYETFFEGARIEGPPGTKCGDHLVEDTLCLPDKRDNGTIENNGWKRPSLIFLCLFLLAKLVYNEGF